MFLSDFATLQNVGVNRKIVDPARYVDQSDLELDRLYIGSPLIADNSATAFQSIETEINEANVILANLNWKNLVHNIFDRICSREEKVQKLWKVLF